MGKSEDRSFKIDLGGMTLLVLPLFGDTDTPTRIQARVSCGESHGEIATALFVVNTPSTGYFEDVWVSPGRRRQGIATAVYDAIAGIGFAVRPSHSLDEDGLLFWEARIASGTERSPSRAPC